MRSNILIVFFILLGYSSSALNSDINELRGLYLLAPFSEVGCNNFGLYLDDFPDKSSVLIQAYRGCFYFIKCQFADNNFDKLRYFKKGKKLLESAIKRAPNLVELRFLRYTIQIETPRFLLYYDNIEKDLTFVNENISKINNKDTQLYILSSIEAINNK